MQTTETADEVELLGETVEYETVASEDATEPRIDVDIRGIRVVLPEGSDTTPDELLRDNASWVLEKKEKYDRYREKAPERQFKEGEMFPYLGETYEVFVEDVEEYRVRDGEIALPESEVGTPEGALREALRNFYRDSAREFFREKVDDYAKKMDVEYESVAVRNQRTRWGSCSAKKNLSFNWRLVMAPEDVAEYVVVHELAHLKEKNHTKTFWRIVREYMPEYKAKADWLEKNSTELIFSEDDL
jgi:predicted metal-dependent hydrolase